MNKPGNLREYVAVGLLVGLGSAVPMAVAAQFNCTSPWQVRAPVAAEAPSQLTELNQGSSMLRIPHPQQRTTPPLFR